MHRTAPRAKDNLAQSVNCAEVEKSALYVLCEMISKIWCNEENKDIEKMLRKNKIQDTNT